jgi:hypothetical protein
MPQHARKPKSKQTTVSKTTQETKPVTKPQETTDPNSPVSKALDAFARAEPGLIEAAASAYAMRTDKVEKKQLVGDENHGVTGSGSHESGVQASIYGRAEVVELGEQYALLVEAGIIVGGSLKLSGELEAKWGKLEAKIGASLHLFGGAYAKVSGRAQIGPNGVGLEGKAGAFAGAKGSGKVEASFDVGSLGLGSELEAEGQAGAWAEAEGELTISKESIAVSGKVSAFAGVEGTVSGSTTARLYGREAFKIKAGLSGDAGVGGKAGGGFKIRGGKIEVNLEAMATLGIGGGGDIDLAFDAKPVAVWAWRQFDKAKWALRTDGKGNDLLDNPAQFVKPLETKIAKYSQEKLDALRAKRAENFVKIEKVQAYVGQVMPRKQVKGRTNAAQIDACIKQGIEDGLISTTKVSTIEASVTDGKVLKLENLPEPDDITAKSKVKSKTGKALDSIVSTGAE